MGTQSGISPKLADVRNLGRRRSTFGSPACSYIRGMSETVSAEIIQRAGPVL